MNTVGNALPFRHHSSVPNLVLIIVPGSEEAFRNRLFCVDWEAKPQLNRSARHHSPFHWVVERRAKAQNARQQQDPNAGNSHVARNPHEQEEERVRHIAEWASIHSVPKTSVFLFF